MFGTTLPRGERCLSISLVLLLEVFSVNDIALSVATEALRALGTGVAAGTLPDWGELATLLDALLRRDEVLLKSITAFF